MANSVNTYDDPDEGIAAHYIWAFIVVQIVAIASAVLLPFGFDKRSWLGLDFEHLILLAALYVLTCLAGCIIAAALRKWMLLLLQIGGVTAVLLVLYLLSIDFIGKENRTPVSPTEVDHYRPPAERIERAPDREQVEKAIQDAERELAKPPRP